MIKLTFFDNIEFTADMINNEKILPMFKIKCWYSPGEVEKLQQKNSYKV